MFIIFFLLALCAIATTAISVRDCIWRYEGCNPEILPYCATYDCDDGCNTFRYNNDTFYFKCLSTSTLTRISYQHYGNSLCIGSTLVNYDVTCAQAPEYAACENDEGRSWRVSCATSASNLVNPPNPVSVQNQLNKMPRKWNSASRNTVHVASVSFFVFAWLASLTVLAS